MAKSDSFFIRGKTTYNDDGVYAQTEIDLGSFVNLGISKSTLLRILNLQVGYREGEGVLQPQPTGVGKVANVAWQLTTQSQTAIVDLSDKSVIATGGLMASTDAQTGGILQFMTDVSDINPSRWNNGYLVGVDSLFLGIDGDTDWLSAFDVAIQMECVLETATQASSVALALSQQ
jgi:hypothetical protein